jgi:hypothetical protein
VVEGLDKSHLASLVKWQGACRIEYLRVTMLGRQFSYKAKLEQFQVQLVQDSLRWHFQVFAKLELFRFV